MLVLTRKIGEEVYIDGGRARVALDGIAFANGVGESAMLSIHGGDAVVLASRAVDGVVDLIVDGHPVSVMVCRIEHDRASLGFTAAKEIIIDREEVHHMRACTTWRITSDGIDATSER